jgi:hypothetical protein
MEGNVVRNRTGRGGEGSVREGKAPLRVDQNVIKACKNGGVLLVGPSELTIEKGDLQKPHGVDGLVEDCGLSKIEVVV